MEDKAEAGEEKTTASVAMSSIMETLTKVLKDPILRESGCVLENVDVGSTSHCILYAAFVTLSACGKGGALNYTDCKNIMKHFLQILPIAGNNYVAVFKLIQDFFSASTSLLPADVLLLGKQLEALVGQEIQTKDEESSEEKSEQDVTPTDEATPSELVHKEDSGNEVKSKYNSKAEFSRLFKQLASAKESTPSPPILKPVVTSSAKAPLPPKKATEKYFVRRLFKQTPAFPRPPPPSGGRPWGLGSSTTSEKSFIILCTDIDKDLGVREKLLQFCLNLPILKSREVFCQPVRVEGEPGIAPLIKSLHQLRNAVEAVSLLLHTPHLFSNLPPDTLSLITKLLVSCVQAACEATMAISNLPYKKKDAATAGATGGTETEKNREGEIVPLAMAESVSGEEHKVMGSVSELLGSLSCCTKQHPSDSPSVARALASSIVSITLKLAMKLLTLQLTPEHLRSLRTLITYHIILSLQPLLSPGGKGRGSSEQAESGMMKMLGGIRLSVSMAELVLYAVENTAVLCEEVGLSSGREVQGSEEGYSSLSPEGIDVSGGKYTSRQCVEMLLTHLPLFRMLFSVTVAAFKKMQAHVLGATSQQDKPGGGGDTLKLPVMEKGGADVVGVAYSGEPAEDRDIYTPSPVSTVSSSGEVGGVYTLYSDASNSEDEKDTEDEQDYELSPNFLMASLGLGLMYGEDTPPAPPPPPLPPRRQVPKESRKLVPRPPLSKVNYWGAGDGGKQQSVAEVKKRKPVLFLHLASVTLKCLNTALIRNQDPLIQKFIREKLQAEHVSCLAWFVQNLDALIAMSDSSSKSGGGFHSELLGLGTELMDLMQYMVMKGVIGHQYLHSVLLNELGLSAKCWPLRVMPAALSLLGRVLVCRLGSGDQEVGVAKNGSDDPLSVNVWKGFLHSLEESACSDEEPDEDVDVVHLQLMFFVWHSFSFETRASLLTACAQAVLRAGHAKQRGVHISPLINGRLLLVLDYMLFQFSEPPPDLAEQVTVNLFQSPVIGCRPASRLTSSGPGGAKPSSASSSHHRQQQQQQQQQLKIHYYTNELQLQYQTVLSKPVNSPSSLLQDVGGGGDPLKEAGTLEEGQMSPRFYSLRMQYVSCVGGEEEEEEEEDVGGGDGGEGEGEGERLKMESKVDEQACRLLLTLPLPSDLSESDQDTKNRGYDCFVTSLVSLMSLGSEYSHQSKPLASRVLLACSAHQCFSLAMNMLSHLPPCYRVLTAIVEGEGISLLEPYGSCLLIHILHLCAKLRMQHVDTEDILDTLLVSGYKGEESEEMVAKVISVVDSPQHFEEQAVVLLEQFIANEEGGMLPLVCITALDLLLCLLVRTALVANDGPGGEEEVATSPATPREEEKEQQQQQPSSSSTPSSPNQVEKYEVVFCSRLGLILTRVAEKLLKYAHHYVCTMFPATAAAAAATAGNTDSDPYLFSGTDADYQVFDVLLSLSGKNLVSPKDKIPFNSHLPNGFREALRVWDSALVIDPNQKKKLSFYEDIQVTSAVMSFLHSHFSAFGGLRTFDPSRSLKGTLNSVLMILEFMANIFREFQEEGEEEDQESQQRQREAWSLLIQGMVPLSCDVMMEFSHSQLLKFIDTNSQEFARSCSRYRITKCLDVLRRPEMQSSKLVGTILADLFQLLDSLLRAVVVVEEPKKEGKEGQKEEETKVEESLFEMIFKDSSVLSNLLVLHTLPHPTTSGEAIREGLKFLTNILTQAEKTSDRSHDLSRILQQVSSIGALSPEDLTVWLKRLVIGSPGSDASSDVKKNVALLRGFVELLAKPECNVDSGVSTALLSSLLKLGSELILAFSEGGDATTSTSASSSSSYAIFRDYFDCLVLLAGTNKEDGHLQLVKEVISWLPKCIKVTSVADKAVERVEESKEEDASPELEESFGPLNTAFSYLSQLTTAVQFSNGGTEYTEKRAMAEQDDPLFDEEDSSEEVGLAIPGGMTDEDDSTKEESDAEDLNNKLCTFTRTQREFVNQHWYHCHTCHLVNGSGVCTICAKVCHKGHDLTYSKLGSFFCDCGAKKNGNCKALVKRSGVSSESARSPHPPPFSDPPMGGRSGRRRKRMKQRHSKRQQSPSEKTASSSLAVTTPSATPRKKRKWVYPHKRKPSFPSMTILKLSEQIETYKSELKDYLDSSGLAEHSLSLLHRTLPAVVRGVNIATSSGCSQARRAMLQLHLSDKSIEYTDNLMASTLGSQEGAFENVRLNFSENQGAQMKQLLSAHSITRVAMCALTSVKGKRQHLCVNHDRGKLTILQLFPILKQADSNRRKLTLTRLSTTSVPFTVLSMSHNPCNEDLLVVCGLTECQLLVINSSGQVTSRSMLHPSVGNAGYIVKALWIPGSQYELVLVSDTFVKVYDTRVDVICPTHYFVLEDGMKIKDATIAVSDEGKFVIIMTSGGVIYSQPIAPSVSASEGPVYFTVDFVIDHVSINSPSKAGSDGLINGGGSSVYYSQSLMMLFFSFYNGITLIATTNPSFSKATKVFEVVLKSFAPAPPGSKAPGPALIYWMEVQHHPGLVCAISKTTSNPVTLLIKPETILIHELKALPNKAKVQGMVAMRQPPSTGDLVPLLRTTLIILCEDGSLRIYVANTSTSTEFWLQPQFQPTSPLAVLRAHPQKLKGQQAVARKTAESLKFPIDFFEHCQLSHEVEFLGNDLLHVYNKQQVIHRLETAGLYIANTNPNGFLVEVRNLQSGTTAVVGVRVLLRGHSMEKTPSFIEVFGRSHGVNMASGASRWIDIPFTRDESIQADKGFKINFGPSMDPSGINFVDTIHVYVKTKESFGWPENTPPPAPSSASSKTAQGLHTAPTAQGDGDMGSEVMPMVLSKDCSAVDSLVSSAMIVLSNHFISVKQEKVSDVMDLVSKGMTLLMYSVPSMLQTRYKFLLTSLAPTKELYHCNKDLLQLSHVIQCLCRQDKKSALMEPEYFQYLLLMLLAMGKARPQNFLQLLSSPSSVSGGDTGEELVLGKMMPSLMEQLETQAVKERTSYPATFIHLLNDLFWTIFDKRPSSLAVAPVVNPGFAAVDLTVACITEVLWSLVLQDHTLLDMVLSHTLKFLLYADSHLCLSCSRVIMRLLKPKKEKPVTETKKKSDGGEGVSVTVELAPGETEEEEKEEEQERRGEEEEEERNEGGGGGEEARANEGQEEGRGEWAAEHVDWPNLQDHPVDLAALQDLMQNPEQLLAIQDMLPDEEAMMNLAIALSLGNEGAVGDQGALQHYVQELMGGGAAGGGGQGGQPPSQQQPGGEEAAASGGHDNSDNPPAPPPPPGDEQLSSESPHAASSPSAAVEEGQGQEQEQEEGEGPRQQPQAAEVDIEERFHSSSPSSIFSMQQEEDQNLLSQLEGVLREGTATPSESHGESNNDSMKEHHQRGRREGEDDDEDEDDDDEQGERREKRAGRRGRDDGDTPDNQHDVNSEPEMANDSSVEEESGEDDQTLVENLNLRLLEEGGEEASSSGGGVSGEGEVGRKKKEEEPNARMAAVRKLLLGRMLEHLGTLEEIGGMRSMCYLQLMLFLVTHLECCREDSALLVKTLQALLHRLGIAQEDELDQNVLDDLVIRNKQREVFLLYLRFFNILMSRRKHKKDGKVSYNAHMLWFITARTLLSHSHIMDFSRLMLKAIMKNQRCLGSAEDTAGTGGTLVPFTNPLDDLSPFFQKQYVKGHTTDIFSAHGRFMAEILLVLPCQLKKTSEVTSRLSTPEFGPEWTETLCEFLLKVAKATGVGRRHVRKLLLQICGSKESYRVTRDMHALKDYMNVVMETCRGAGFEPEAGKGSLPLNLGYKSMLGLIEQLKTCGEVVATRTSNWQLYCQKEKNTLPYLFQVLFVLDEGLAPLILQLIYSALSGTPPTKEEGHSTEAEPTGSSSKMSRGAHRKETEEQKKAKEKGDVTKVSIVVPNREQCKALVHMFLSFVDTSTLSSFSELYLLKSNQSSLRWQAHQLLHCLYQYASAAEQVSLVEMLWSLWPTMPNYGHKASQFVDLLGFLTISTPEVLQKESLCQQFVERAVSLLKVQNSLLSTHPNSHIYSQLRSLVDFDGFYLESEPCLVCNDPEVQSSMLKLSSVKSEIRYTPNMILVKLTGSHSISQILLRISEIKRTKMVRTVNVYYSNRTVQNVIELKNKRGMWLMAKTCNLTAGQNEVKIDFPLPIVACNIIIQFSDFYDNLQGGSEMLQCPRCQAAVPAHPGVCGTCGENVYQCHKCRAINYDEKDPFLCNSCGFSKYAKFDISMEGRSCSAVDPIESEEDRQKTLLSINQLLEKADKIYKQQVIHRNELDQLLICLASGATFTTRNWNSHASDIGVNKGIQLVAQRYCIECRHIYADLSKIIQNVLASRKELVKYDSHKGEVKEPGSGQDGEPTYTPSPSQTPAHLKFPSQSTTPPVTPLGGPTSQPLPHHHQQGQCYGCASASTEHCITLLKALTFQSATRRPLVREKLIRELVEVNLRSGGPQMQRDVRKLLCQLTRDDAEATAELNGLIYSRILSRLQSSHVDPNLASLVRPEMVLLMASLDMEDSCWEQRLKTVVQLFKKSQSCSSPAVMAGVTMPCLKIMHTLINPHGQKKLAASGPDVLSDRISVHVSDWLSGDPRASFESWRTSSCQMVSDLKTMEKEELHKLRLMEKYAKIWRERTKKVSQFRSSLRQASWLRSMLFNPSSQSARRSTCNMIASLCQGEVRHRQMLDLLCGFLDDVGSAGEHAQEFLELLKMLIEDSSGKWKSYLAMRGVLPKIGGLITREIEHLQHLEETTLSSDLSQGFALKMLTALLQSFLSIDRIKQLFKGKMVGIVLNGYLSLKCLVVQRTKRVDESQGLLLEMLEDLTSGTEEERKAFMVSCVETLNMFKQTDLVTPIFVFEQLCNIIRPEDNDVGEFFLSLEKDPQQEEFLQGRMQGNPYPSTSPGLGPLMRDVKNKICTDCELVALLEDDTGMELLVSNKIISLDLPVKEVYKKIWCAQPSQHGDTMRVVYRMRGLLGDATEDMIEQLDDGKDKDTNEEEDYKMAAILVKCGGLDAILSRLTHIKDFIQGHSLILAALKLLGYCVKLKEIRQYLLSPSLSTLGILLGTLDQALHYEERSGNGIGAAVAECVLRVTERILQEASSERRVLARTISHEGLSTPTEVEGDDQLQVFLKHIESPFVQSNPALREGLMHVIPFLTFGVTSHMNVLLQHFAPYLNFEKFDSERSPENRLYLDCFCVVASGIGSDASGEKLKDLAIEMNITPSAVTYLKTKVPQKSHSFETAEWKTCVLQPSLPYVLKMLTGLSHSHSKTQSALLSVVGELHLLEQIASDQHIGTLAENLLEAMMEDDACKEEIKKVRRATRQEKKKLAMAMRAKELDTLGMEVNEKGQVIVAKSSDLVKEMERELVDEVGLKCCICLEGYRNQPNKILGVYTYTRKVTLDEFENKAKKTKGYATVSHFNVVHYECHSSAVTLARGRDEWESAMLQNTNTKCNGLLPVWGSQISESNFSSSLARHNNFLHECTGLYDHSYHMFLHDLRLLLLRFAYEKSFSAESGGGGAQSNIYLVPYLMHVAIYIMNTTRSHQREEKNLEIFLSAPQDKWVSSSYELDGPQYAIVQALFLQSLTQWRQHRLTFLRRLVILAHARSISSTPIKSLPSPEPAQFSIYKPFLILFGLVDGLQEALKVSLQESLKGGEVASALLDYIRSNDVAVMEGCDKVLAVYQDKLLGVDSFGSFCQVTGVEGVNQESFISEQISSVLS